MSISSSAASPSVKAAEKELAQSQDVLASGGNSQQNAIPIATSSAPRNRKRTWALVGLAALAAIIVVPVVVSRKGRHSSPSDSNSNAAGASVAKDGAIGFEGSTVTMENGTTFTYRNPFGGHWTAGELDNTARAQNWTKSLAEEWDYVQDRIYGVNLGGWLVLEPFISPEMFEPYVNRQNISATTVIDEYSLAKQYLSEPGGQDNLRAKMTAHYDTFVTEKDFADIAAAGLAWVRLPIPFWAFETYPEQDEPYLQGVAWTYVLKAIRWARKYGIRLNIDIHTAPGSQNGLNHSGKQGSINWLQGPQGLVNAQRMLNYIRQVTEFISTPEIAPVVPMLSVLNEPKLSSAIGQEPAFGFFQEVYTMMRNISGTGKGNGPYIVLHNGFLDSSKWQGFLQGSDRMALDKHTYLAFSPQYFSTDYNVVIPEACNYYAPSIDQSRVDFGVSIAGEWSNAIFDCGYFLRGVNVGNLYEGTYSSYERPGKVYGNCSDWQNYPAWNTSTVALFKGLATASMDANKDWFFWNWKIGNDPNMGLVGSPLWSYRLGLELGIIPADPRSAQGACASQIARIPGASLSATTSWSSSFSDWQTGGAAAYAPNTQRYAWPPVSLSSVNAAAMSALPSLTQTGATIKLPAPTFAAANASAFNSAGGWAATAHDLTPFYATVSGCQYATDVYDLTAVPGQWPCGTTVPTSSGFSRRAAPVAARGAKATPAAKA
ncbi:glycoside hydrolase family 5 protein [Tilletiaria anomala UBC 951]|uniref:glucan 1,3-beta-glucosidase n=1 Tax=Tilletiaria anomala (strain ATCC 24038 / CBS 436.72 / UBC 951) TaxID=1037660 RepID=A0A066VEC3_TILAU|nr:glycoside hydrolase family 5 protein [Tilletiaria anomala UBC 951]KDN37114.1 glycoside hydrolase family 5 protein [Tilletiaria anomala UBC 951]